MTLSFVVIDNLDGPWLSVTPVETDPPLVVNADAMQSAPIAVKDFETVARRDPKIFEPFCGIDSEKLGSRSALNLVRQALDRVAYK
jgi:hypothetical protein